MARSSYRQKLKINDSAPIHGMNTVDDRRTLPEGQCFRLLNAFPGNPPLIRTGCPGQLKTSTDEYDTFQQPATFFIFSDDTEDYGICWVYNSNTDLYYLARFQVDGSDEIYKLGAAAVTTPSFGFLSLFDNMYCFVDKVLSSWQSDTHALSHKIIEGTTVVRDMCISEAGKMYGVPAEASCGYFPKSIFVGYGFQFVRRNDAAAFTTGANSASVILPPGITGQPQNIETFLPGVCIGVSDTDNNQTIGTGTDDNRMFEINLSSDSLAYIPEIINAIAQGATHLRVFRSHLFASEELATDATKFFVVDIGLDGTLVYCDVGVTQEQDDASLETNQLLTGYTVAPYGCFSAYSKGRLFIMAPNGMVYYSETPGGDGFVDSDLAQEYPQYSTSLFKPLSYFINCDSADGIPSSGMEILDNDIYFFKESKIWVLYGGDPTATAVTLLNGGKIGCPFPYTIIPVNVAGYGNCIFFMSNLGPALITSGARIQLFPPFKILDFWPDLSSELFGQLKTQHDTVIKTCSALFFKNTIWVFYENSGGDKKIYGYYFSPTNTDEQGPLEVELALESLYGNISAIESKSLRAMLLGKSDDKLVVTEFLANDTYEDLLATFFVNANGSNTAPYTSRATGATTVSGLIASGVLYDGATVCICDGGAIVESGNVLFGNFDLTLKSDPNNTTRPIIKLGKDKHIYIQPTSGARTFVCEDIEIRKDKNDAGTFSDYMLYYDSTGTDSDNVTIQRCVFSVLNNSTPGAGEYCAIGVYCDGVGAVRIRNNEIRNVKRGIVALLGTPDTGTVYIYNNSIYNAATYSIYGQYIGNDTIKYEIVNNIIHGNSQSGTYGIYFVGHLAPFDPTGWYTDNRNEIYGIDSDKRRFCSTGGTPTGTNALYTDPLFAAPTTSLQISSSSPALNSGATYTQNAEVPEDDILKTDRSGYSRGAYEEGLGTE